MSAISRHHNVGEAGPERLERAETFCLYKTQAGSGCDVAYVSTDHIGGGKGIRTPDPLHAMQVLYQLSYTPNWVVTLSEPTKYTYWTAAYR